MPNNILPLQTNETIRLVPLIYRVNPFSVQIMSDVIKEGHVDILHGDFALKIDGWTK